MRAGARLVLLLAEGHARDDIGDRLPLIDDLVEARRQQAGFAASRVRRRNVPHECS